MTSSRDDLERIAYLPEGDLAQLAFPVLLIAYSALRRSLLLRVSNGPVSKLVTIVDGTPVDCQSNLLQDTIGRYLSSRGLLGEEQADALQAESVASNRPLEQLLAAKGRIPGEVLAKSRQQHLARKLLDAFAWERGTFACAALGTPPDTAIKLKVPQLVLMGVEKLTPERAVEASLASYGERPLHLNQSPIFPLSDLRLNAQQQSLIDGLRAGKRLEQLDPTGSDGARRFLHALGLLGYLRHEPAAAAATSESPRPEAAPTAMATLPVPPPIAKPHAPRPRAEPSTERRRDLLELYDRYRRLDAFDLLSVGADAPPTEIEQAFLSFAERTAPWSFDGGEIESKARELFLAGVRALGDLHDPDKRTSLRARRESPLDRAQEAAKSAREAFKIQTALLDPRQQFHKGVALGEKKRYAEALEQLQYAVDCDPQNATYRAELARCHWLSQPLARARGSVRDLEEATRLDPACGIAFLYLGEILVSLERIEEAREVLKRAAQLLLPDRRGLDMLKSLPAPGLKGKTIGKLGKWF